VLFNEASDFADFVPRKAFVFGFLHRIEPELYVLPYGEPANIGWCSWDDA
jgi:hypothetical protein